MMVHESREALCSLELKIHSGDRHLSTILTTELRVRNGALVGHGTGSYMLPE